MALALAFAYACLASNRADAQGVGSHLGGGVLAGEAAGLDDGYVHFGGLVPLTQPGFGSLWFADGDLQLYNDGSDLVGGNVGVGARTYCNFTGAILGANLYYDRRDLGLAEFNQIGFGLESLGSVLDVRINLAVPVGAATDDVYKRTGFIGHGLGDVYDRYAAMKSLDAEVGVLLVSRYATQLRGFVGAYSLFHDLVDDTAGVRGRVEARIADQVFVGGYVEHDGEFGTTGGLTLDFRYGRGPSSREDSSQTLLARLGDPVQRRRHIVVAKDDHVDYFTAGGSQIRVDHVAASTSGGSGSIDDPFGSLADIAGSKADVVYVTSGVYDGQSVVVRKSGQQLLAGSMDQTLTTDRGDYTIPGDGPVVIRNSPGTAIAIAADNVTVVGFRIESSGWDGISSAPSPTSTGLVIANNTITDAGRHGVYFEDFATGEIRGNVVTNATAYGIQITGLDGDIIGNTVTGSGSSGIESAYHVPIYGDVRDNVVNGNGGVGIRLIGSVRGDVSGNTADGNAGTGIFLLGAVSLGDLANNHASDNRGHGIEVTGRVSGDVVGNTTNDNYFFNDAGLQISGAVYGDLLNNQSDGNAGAGISVSEVWGQVSGNQANGNGVNSSLVVGRGITINSVGGDFTDNVANGNYRHGVYLQAVGGTYSGNVTSDNGASGSSLTSASDLSGNIANNNASGGFYVGNVFGVVAGNTASGNGGNGFFVTGYTGDIVGNSANGNGEDGIHVGGSSVGSVANNTATGNADDGIDITGTINGVVSGNTLAGNGDQGLEN